MRSFCQKDMLTARKQAELGQTPLSYDCLMTEVHALRQLSLTGCFEKWATKLCQPLPSVPPPSWTARHKCFIFATECIQSQANFHIILEENRTPLSLLQAALQEFYNNVGEKQLAEEFEVGTICVAPNSQDNCWYRAEIISDGSDEVLIKFIDLGYTQFVHIGDVKPLQELFSRIPPLAIQCEVFCLEKTELWRERIAHFNKVLSSNDFNLLVEFNVYPETLRRSGITLGLQSPNKTAQSYHVTLYDLSEPPVNLCEPYCYRKKLKHVAKEILDAAVGYARVAMDSEVNSQCDDEPMKTRRPNKPSVHRKDLLKPPKPKHDKTSSTDGSGSNNVKKKHRKRTANIQQKEQVAACSTSELSSGDGDVVFTSCSQEDHVIMPSVSLSSNHILKLNGVTAVFPSAQEPVAVERVFLMKNETAENVVTAEGVIDQLYATWGTISSPAFDTSVLLKLRLTNKSNSTDLLRDFTPGDKVLVEAARERDLKMDSNSICENTATTEESSCVEATSEESNDSVGERWIAVKVTVLQNSTCEKLFGSGVVMSLSRHFGIISPRRTGFSRGADVLDFVGFSRDALIDVPGCDDDRFALTQLLQTGQSVCFCAFKTVSLNNCKWLAGSVTSAAVMFEGIGKVIHCDPVAGFGFIAHLYSELDCDYALQQLRIWKKPKRGPDFNIREFSKFLVRFDAQSFDFPFTAQTEINKTERNGNGSISDLPLNLPLSETNEKWVRFRAFSGEPGKPWDWQAAKVELILCGDDLNQCAIDGFLLLPTCRLQGAFVSPGNRRLNVSVLVTTMQSLRPMLDELVSLIVSMFLQTSTESFSALENRLCPPTFVDVSFANAAATGSSTARSSTNSSQSLETVTRERIQQLYKPGTSASGKHRNGEHADPDLNAEIRKIIENPELTHAAALLVNSCPKLFAATLGKCFSSD